MAIIINGRGRVGARVTSGGGAPSYDSDAQAFFTAASITDPTQMNAVNTLVTGLKSNNLWTKMRALYPIVGGNATAHSFNLINTSLYQGTFTSGWTQSANGMLPNGTSAYFDTTFNPSTQLASVNDVHFSVYINNSVIANTSAIGALSSNSPGSALYITPRYVTNETYAFIGKEQTGPNGTFFPNSETKGFYVISRTSTTNLFSKKNGVLKNTCTVTNDGTLPNRNFYLGALNSFSGNVYGTHQICTFTIGTGLSDTDATNLSTIVNTFNTTLGRNTY